MDELPFGKLDELAFGRKHDGLAFGKQDELAGATWIYAGADDVGACALLSKTLGMDELALGWFGWWDELAGADMDGIAFPVIPSPNNPSNSSSGAGTCAADPAELHCIMVRAPNLTSLTCGVLAASFGSVVVCVLLCDCCCCCMSAIVTVFRARKQGSTSGRGIVQDFACNGQQILICQLNVKSCYFD